ncbi:MAG: hypothetical protein ACOC3Z_01760, partial [Nanoarchaeota archaeon]
EMIMQKGAVVCIEVFNGIQEKKKLISKYFHAADAKQLFEERNEETSCFSGIMHVNPVNEKEEYKDIVDFSVVIHDYAQEILTYMIEFAPREDFSLHKRKNLYPYNSDFWDTKQKGIPPFEQQIIYRLIRDVLNHNWEVNSAFENIEDIFEIKDKRFRRIASHTRGAFLEMYSATCWMYALEGKEYDLAQRVMFPLWREAYLNGHSKINGYGLDKKGMIDGTWGKAEIDSVIMLSEKDYRQSLEKILRLHQVSG